MSQNTARHDQHAKSVDEDVADPRAHQPAHKQGVRSRQPVRQPAGDGGVGPDEGEFELIGDDDLSPAAPNATDPDAGSGRVRKIARGSGRNPGRRQQDSRH